MMRSKTVGHSIAENLGLAADLLQRMFSELSVLAANIVVLSLKLSNSEAEIRHGLRALNELIASFQCEDRAQSYAQLREQAAPLIKSLSTKLDELALCAYEANLENAKPALEASDRYIGQSDIIQAEPRRS